MADAMDAVFIENFVKSENKAEANRILDAVRTEMLRGIDNLKWMKSEDRQTARNKISESLYKIGYADYMVDHEFMDSLYEAATIDESDFFGNMLNLNKLYRKQYNRLIGRQGSRTLWAYHIFDPIVEYYNPWHELIATAAVFQSPLFSHEGPSYYNFGTVGSMIAKHLIHAVDEIGSSFRLDGQHLGNWWTHTTTQHYRTIRKCAMDAQSHLDFGTFNVGDEQITRNVSNFASDYVPELLADASGLKLAYKAFKVFGKSQPEKMVVPAGFPGRTIDQMFFLAFAQANCQNTPDNMKLYQLDGNQYPSKARVNLAVSQVAEFSEAFQCKPGQPMHPKKQCVLF
ncbi:endothelin-converting enzyme 1 [Elysia marginata]|uniref:Endothelin-converting enzyme 1 n=1 Tax=Elysia marginata TaxID=1093978 RepID=A0AAV4HU32_9GAST|nr:endothelin-converting enzyme 1 [Elysia marginata]